MYQYLYHAQRTILQMLSSGEVELIFKYQFGSSLITVEVEVEVEYAMFDESNSPTKISRASLEARRYQYYYTLY